MTDWTNEERERVVKVFEWLIKQDKKQSLQQDDKDAVEQEALENS